MQLSVIIPIYNGEKFIPDLIRQLQEQTYQDFEVIFVDDGSKDHSFQHLLDLQTQSKLNMNIVQQTNSGQGQARNNGIDRSSGKYLLFIDQDDIIDKDYFQTLLNEASKRDADLVLSGYKQVEEDGTILSTRTLPSNDWARFMCITPWAKVYKRALLIEHNIRFKELSLGEDIFFNLYAYAVIEEVHGKIALLPDYTGYGWRENRASFSRTAHKNISKESDLLDLFSKIVSNPSIMSRTQRSDFAYFILKTAIYHVLYVAPTNRLQTSIAYKNTVFSYLKEHIPSALKLGLVFDRNHYHERKMIQMITICYMMLYRMRMDNVIICLLRAIRNLKKCFERGE